MDDLGDIALRGLLALLRQGTTVDEAAASLRRTGMTGALIEAAIAERQRLVDGVREYRDPPVLLDPAELAQAWYIGPRDDDTFWPSLVRHLRTVRGWSREQLDSLDLSSTRVVSLLASPSADAIRTRGLVLGYVQSGKTSNFTAVISKAADAGYRLAVVLSGVHNNLRRQTQLRLDEQIVELNPMSWVALTTEQADFGRPVRALPLLAQPGLRLLAVVKKNAKRLANLVSWLEDAGRAGILERCPILVIDDEADQASLNTKKEEEQRAAINNLILRLLTFPKVAYVGYTATPFGNLFVDPTVPEDLYPRDFIVDLPRPPNYFGPEQLFGRQRFTADEQEFLGYDMIRLVPADEAAALQPPKKKADRAKFEPSVTGSLEAALRWFLLATAARTVRDGRQSHSTMLIHSSQYVVTHALLWRPVCVALLDLRTRIRDGDVGLVSELRRQWDDETARVPPDSLGAAPVAFEDILEELPATLQAMVDLRTPTASGVVVDNSYSVQRLVYDEDDPRPVVVIGGNTLSRGLTLEGLVASHFIRTASAYDTLLQMGRWFGYRQGYEDLPRIWMTAELETRFRFLAGVEHEIRLDISRYETERITPLQAAVRIRTHPKMAITSALKMRKAVEHKMSFSGQRPQTILFKHRDEAWLRANVEAARSLVSGALAGGARAATRGSNRLLFDVPVDLVMHFLDPVRGYHFHEENAELQSGPLESYIEAQNRYGDLLVWNLAIVSQQSGRLGQLDIGTGEEVNLIARSKLDTSPPGYANINTLMSKVDRVADLDVPGAASLPDNALLARRTGSAGAASAVSNRQGVDAGGYRQAESPTPLGRRGERDRSGLRVPGREIRPDPRELQGRRPVGCHGTRGGFRHRARRGQLGGRRGRQLRRPDNRRTVIPASDLELAWAVIGTYPEDTDALRVRSTGAELPTGEILVASGPDGHRHLLLPLAEDAAFATDTTTRGVHIVRRLLDTGAGVENFMDVECLLPHLNQTFAVLSYEMLAAAVADSEHPGAACRRVLDRWREFLGAEGSPLLPDHRIVGLLAELLVLMAVLEHDHQRRVDVWTGPSSAVHDLRRGGHALEVKGTVLREAHFVQIHGVDQLEPPSDGSLHLASYRFERDDTSTLSLPSAIRGIRSLGVDNLAFSELLASAGYDAAHEDEYEWLRYRTVERRVYSVDSSFPRVVPSSFATGAVPPGVIRLSYTVDLTNEPPDPLDAAGAEAAFKRLATS